MKITILCVGVTRTQYIREATAQYIQRISHYVPVELVTLPDIKSTRSLSISQQKKREGEMILSTLQPSDTLILMDERGREYTSREFADWIQKHMSSGARRLVLTIGGPYGFSDDVYTRATAKISLSRMTFSHEMVRLFLTEQIYRAMTILRGEPYHHD